VQHPRVWVIRGRFEQALEYRAGLDVDSGCAPELLGF